jgi:secreted trypsin-like serine protease
MLVSRAVRDHLETLRAIAVAFGAFLITTMAGAVFATAAQTCLEPRDGLGAKRVIGGDPANPRHWPGYAQLRWFDPQTGDAMYLCGGTVVDPQTVLTAAHCFRTTRQVDGKWIDAVSGKVLQVVVCTENVIRR